MGREQLGVQGFEEKGERGQRMLNGSGWKASACLEIAMLALRWGKLPEGANLGP